MAVRIQKRVFVILYFFVLCSFTIPLITILSKLFSVPVDNAQNIPKTEYVLMLIQAVLGIVTINIPMVLSKKFKTNFPYMIKILYTLFLFCAIYLGEIRRFYIEIALWDDMLHCFSSILTGSFGFMLIYLINKRTGEKNNIINLSPLFLSFFAFCFSVSVGVIWELYEFALDRFMDLNMQKYRTDTGQMYIGRNAVKDTMNDLFLDMLGAMISAFFGYASIVNKKGFISSYLMGENDKAR